MNMLQQLVQQAVLNRLVDCEDYEEVEKEGLIEKCVMLSGQLKTGAMQIHQELHIDDANLIENGGIFYIKARNKVSLQNSCFEAFGHSLLV